jgi:uncharacterized protein (DUF58 family)
MQRLVVKELEEFSAGSITVILDLYTGCDFGRGTVTSLDIAVGAAAYLIESYLTTGSPVRLLLADRATVKSLSLYNLKDLASVLRCLAEAMPDSVRPVSDILRTCSRCEVVVITTNPERGLFQSIREASSRGARVSVALIDPEPFGRRLDVRSIATELEQAGAIVELVRETEQ